jgi:hypothetical protein
MQEVYHKKACLSSLLLIRKCSSNARFVRAPGRSGASKARPVRAQSRTTESFYYPIDPAKKNSKILRIFAKST